MKGLLYLLFASILILSLLLQCNDADSFKPKQVHLVSVSDNSRGLGVKEYNLDSKYISTDSQFVNVKYKIVSSSIAGDVKMSFLNSEILKLSFVPDSKISSKNVELILNYDEMSLSFFDGSKNNILRLRKEYNIKEEYRKTLEIFVKNKILLKVLLSSSDDMLGNINFSGTKRKGSKTNTIEKDSFMSLNYCPQGGNYHTETVLSSTRSLGTTQSSNNL